MVTHILRTYQGSRVIGTILDSGDIENMFSSQHKQCNGSNTNSTALVYSKSINTILITNKRQRSSKRNAATTSLVDNAQPYDINKKSKSRCSYISIVVFSAPCVIQQFTLTRIKKNISGKIVRLSTEAWCIGSVKCQHMKATDDHPVKTSMCLDQRTWVQKKAVYQSTKRLLSLH